MLVFPTVIIVVLIQGLYCQLYGLLLHNPLRDFDVERIKHRHPSPNHHPKLQLEQQQQQQHQASRQFYMTAGDSGNDDLRAESSDADSSTSVNNEQPGLFTETILIRCRRDADCIDDNSPDADNLMYCDRHYGYCDFFRSTGELCRTDSQCDAGLICLFGRCETPQAPGASGARCSSAVDCNAGLCCARQHGERICKPKLKLGQQCFVPLGGLDYSLNELCPCEDGLECAQQHKRKRIFGKTSAGTNNVVHRCSLG